MSSYHYKAIDGAGRVVKGVIPAFSELDIEQELQRRGLFLIQSSVRGPSRVSRFFERRRLAPKFLIEFYYRFAQTLEIGLPIVSSLEEIGHFLPSNAFKRVVGEIRFAIESGRTLLEAISSHPNIFKPVDSALVGMGEKAGVLPRCLRDLAAYHEWKADLRTHLLKATLYPAFILCTIAAVIGVWIGYVLPQMTEVLKELNVAMPLPTEIILGVRNFLAEHGIFLLGGFLAAAAAALAYQKTPSGRLRFHRLVLRLPVIGRIAANIVLARLCRNFATLLSSGMNVNDIFEILSDRLLGNHHVEGCLRAAHAEILRGESIAGGFEKTGEFPVLLVGALRHGESTGTLDEALKRMGEFYDREVKRSVQVLTGAIEPVAILSLGGVFGFIVLSILLPLYDVLGGLGKAY
jgi:type IV pilus assembly protein PilC